MKTYMDELKERNRESYDNVQKMNDLFKTKSNRAATPQSPAVTAPVTQGSRSNASVPTVSVPTTVGGYDINTDFMAEKQKAEAVGDYGKAKEMEYWRNQKIGVLGLPYQTTHTYNYLDPYAGQLEKMRTDIQNREPFSYDYEKDDAYIAMKKLKEKEADKAYADGYAQLSTAFDGDIPVNMINKLMSTKNEIIDSADSYIPQLRQMAYDMYGVEGDEMRRNYAMVQDVANQDYNRWANERDFYISGNENEYVRGIDQRNYDRDVYTSDRAYDRGIFESDRNFDYGVKMDAQAREDAIADMALSLFKTGDFPSIDAAYDAVQRVYRGAAAGSPSSYGSESESVKSTSPGSASRFPSVTKDTHEGEVPKVVQTGRLEIDKDGKIRVTTK